MEETKKMTRHEPRSPMNDNPVRRYICFSDFKYRGEYWKLVYGLRDFETHIRSWTKSRLISDADVVYARELLEFAVMHADPDMYPPIDERILRCEWARDDVADLVSNLADNHFPALAALNGRAAKAVARCINELVSKRG